MNLMLCMHGEAEELPFLPEIAALGAGLELGSYGMMGVRSESNWRTRLSMHEAVRSQFAGPLAVHGPFIGMDFAHIDHLLKEAVQHRMDLTFDAAQRLNALRVVVHGGHKPEVDLFKIHGPWLRECTQFWRQEIRRWADAGIQIVLENDFQDSPDLLVQLVDIVDSPFLGLCLDIGHQHAFSTLDAAEWVRRMDKRLYHVHLHDNDRTGDHHWPLGRGTICFEPLYESIQRHAPGATLSVEVQDTMETKMADLRALAARFLVC